MHCTQTNIRPVDDEEVQGDGASSSDDNDDGDNDDGDNDLNWDGMQLEDDIYDNSEESDDDV